MEKKTIFNLLTLVALLFAIAGLYFISNSIAGNSSWALPLGLACVILGGVVNTVRGKVGKEIQDAEKKKIIYIHGKGGSAAEAKHYEQLFPEYDVIGFDYKSETPWDAEVEFSKFFKEFGPNRHVEVIANSIGAFFSLNSLNDYAIKKAYFISPIVNMEKLISDMMIWAGVNEDELKEKGTIETDFGETLSFEYLTWVREHPYTWNIPTSILYGSKDNLQSIDTIKEFASAIHADLTVMDNGEHWFHTEEQMKFLDDWLVGDGPFFVQKCSN